MPDLTTELNLALANDNDDQADYLDLDTGPSLRTSLKTVDGLFNTGTGHTHNGAHQGGTIGLVPIGAIPDGSITSAKIANGTIVTADLADGAVTTPKIAASVTLTTPTLTTPTITDPTITGTIAGGPTFSSGPTSLDWFRVGTTGLGIYNAVVNAGIGFDAGGAFSYGTPGGGHLITETAAQTLTNKTLTSPALNSAAVANPTLSGTVSGVPTWASAQSLPVGSKIGSSLAVANINPSGTDCKIDSGTIFFNAIPNGGPTPISANFSTAFAVAPNVIATINGLSGGDNSVAGVHVVTRNITTTGFVAVVYNATGASQSLTVDWMAFGH